MRSSFAVRAATVAAAVALVPGIAQAATAHPAVVAQKSQGNLPQLVDDTPRPHVDAIATGGGKTYAAGLFDTVGQDGKLTIELGNLMAFNTSTGVVDPSFKPILNGQVRDLELDTATNSLFVAGDFTTVDGATRNGLVKLDATTGAVKDTFRPRVSGTVNDVSLVTVAGRQRLFAGGGLAGKLVSLDPSTGASDGYLSIPITDAIPLAWGGVAVYQLAVDSAGTRLIATGNFQTVAGQARTRFFMLDLGPSGATLAPWYYQPFAKPCASTAARRIAYLQGVDWAPSHDGGGRQFNVTATGQVPKYKSEIWHPWNSDAQNAQTTVCDAVGRFSVSDTIKPIWVNYTGGDSVWRVQDTGAAVYVSGHFQWLDNADGSASKPATCTQWDSTGTKCLAGIGDKGGNGAPPTPAARRLGIGAIDPSSGRALSWAPQASGFKQGGKSLLATSEGLWIGNDSKRFGKEDHYGLAFARLPSLS